MQQPLVDILPRVDSVPHVMTHILLGGKAVIGCEFVKFVHGWEKVLCFDGQIPPAGKGPYGDVRARNGLCLFHRPVPDHGENGREFFGILAGEVPGAVPAQADAGEIHSLGIGVVMGEHMVEDVDHFRVGLIPHFVFDLVMRGWDEAGVEGPRHGAVIIPRAGVEGVGRRALFQAEGDFVPRAFCQIVGAIYISPKEGELGGDDDEGQIPFLNPGFVERAEDEEVVEVGEGVAAFAVAVEEEEDGPGVGIVGVVALWEVEEVGFLGTGGGGKAEEVGHGGNGYLFEKEHKSFIRNC